MEIKVLVKHSQQQIYYYSYIVYDYSIVFYMFLACWYAQCNSRYTCMRLVTLMPNSVGNDDNMQKTTHTDYSIP